jgi:hypothetical protein
VAVERSCYEWLIVSIAKRFHGNQKCSKTFYAKRAGIHYNQ